MASPRARHAPAGRARSRVPSPGAGADGRFPIARASMRPGSRYAIAADTESHREHRAAVAHHARRATCWRRPPSRPSDNRRDHHPCLRVVRICVNVGFRPLPGVCSPLRFLGSSICGSCWVSAGSQIQRHRSRTIVRVAACAQNHCSVADLGAYLVRLHIEHRTSREQFLLGMGVVGVRRRSPLFLANHTAAVRSVSHVATSAPPAHCVRGARCAGLPINRSTIWTNDLLLV